MALVRAIQINIAKLHKLAGPFNSHRWFLLAKKGVDLQPCVLFSLMLIIVSS